MFLEETYKLIDIAKSIDIHTLKLIGSYSSKGENRNIAINQNNDYITFEMSIKNGTTTQTTASTGSTLTISMGTYNVPTYMNIKIKVSNYPHELISIEWNETSNYYVQSIGINPHSHTMLQEPTTSMSALIMKNGKILINGILYDSLDKSPDAFLNDIDGENNFNIMDIFNIVENFYEK